MKDKLYIEDDFNDLKEELDEFIKLVMDEQDRIIPLVGDDCFIGSVDDSKNTFFPLRQWIAEKLLRRKVSDDIKHRIQSEGYRGFDILFEAYKCVCKNNDGGLVDFKFKIKTIVDKGIKDGHLILREDVKNFLCAGKFAVIATTCPFHILEKELTLKGKQYNVSSFAPFSSSNDPKSVLKIPSIYRVFGDSSKDDFVLDEDDLLRFIHYLNQTDAEKGYGASQLVKYIKDKGKDNTKCGLLMPIGCGNLPNWLFRFLWYPFSQDRLIGQDKNRSYGGVWYKHSTDEGFYKFLRKYSFKTFSESTDALRKKGDQGDPVLLSLKSEFEKKVDTIKGYASKQMGVTWMDNDEWDFFISYSSDNYDVANNVYKILTTQCNKKVWMDNRNIVFGDEYWSAIQYGIEHSHKFLFIITDSYLNKAITKNYRYCGGRMVSTGVYEEIKRINQFFLENKWDGQNGYIYPLIIEDTKVTYTDYKGELQENISLTPGLLETLHTFKEYEMLQTEALFNHKQGLVCAPDKLEENLTRIFNN